MSSFFALSENQLEYNLKQLQEKYDTYKEEKLSLNMSRGKPCPEQLDLTMEMLDVVSSKDNLTTETGVDIRNYGGLDGIPQGKEFFAQMLEVTEEEILIGGNSSLNMMHDCVSRAMLHGVYGSKLPWSKMPKVKFLCPSPGYDRHFAICELFDIEMIPIEINEEGPDMDVIERLVSQDETIKGMWCVPKYSNPDGITYSDQVVDRLAKMKTKAEDFRIFWDNAYTIHHLTDKPDQLKDIFAACKEVGNAHRVFIFSSTSKITFPGAGIAVMAASEENLKHIRKQLAIQTIGPDKINQLRHVRFFKDIENLKLHMKKHAAIIKPKFDMVLNMLETQLGGKEIAWWSEPNGGYFISLNTLDHCAKAVVDMAAAAGVTLTEAGATYPYGRDPKDRNIRLAPTFPSLTELKKALEIVAICVQIVSIQKIIGEKK